MMGNRSARTMFLAMAMVASGPGGAWAAEVVKLDLVPGKNGATVVISHTGGVSFRSFQSERRQSIVLEAENLVVPPQLTRVLSGGEKGPVAALTPYNSTNGGKPMAKLVLQLRQRADFTASDRPGRFVVEVRPKAESLPYIGKQESPDRVPREMDSLTNTDAAEKKSEEIAKRLVDVLNSSADPKQYFGSLVTFEASQADVHDIFRLVGEASGLNIISDGDVNAKSNFSLKDVPWDQLLDIVVQQSQFRAAVMGNVVRIMTIKSYLDIENAKKAVELEKLGTAPTIMGVIPLGFADATKMKNMIQNLLNKQADNSGVVTTVNNASGDTNTDTKMNSLKRGYIEVDDRSNSLVVTDTKDGIDRIRKLVKELDIPLPQVLIDAKIVIADESFTRQIGTNWGFAAISDTSKAGFGTTFNQTTATSSSGSTSSTNGFSTGTAGKTAFSVSGITNGMAVSGAIGATSRAALNASLQLAELNSRSKTVAAPRVIVNNNENAKITDGQTINQLVQGGLGSAGAATSATANLGLDVTPQVTSHGSVQLKVDITKDAVAASTGNTTTLTQKHLITKVLVDSGATLVLGGVYQAQKSRAENGVPLLKDLPFIGNLFRLDDDKSNKSELMVFITPQIIDPEAGTQSL